MVQGGRSALRLRRPLAAKVAADKMMLLTHAWLLSRGLFGLAEQEHDPGPFRSCNLALCFVGSLWSGQSVAGLVVTRRSIHQDYVAMGAIALDII